MIRAEVPMTHPETRRVAAARSQEAIPSRPLYEAHLELGAPVDVGMTPRGLRRIWPIQGGTFAGPSLRGELLPGGTEWLLIRPDGILELDLRAAGRMEDGEVLYARERGYLRAAPEVLLALARGEAVDAGAYTLRLVATFETASPRHAQLNGTLAIGTGVMRPGRIDVVMHEVL